MLTLVTPTSGEDLADMRVLMQEYEDFLLQSLGPKHVCYANIGAEIQALPAPFDRPPAALVLARVDGEAAGCVALKSLPGDVVEVKRLYTRSRFRGYGVARALMEHLLEHAVAHNQRAIVLDTVPSAMGQAVSLYRSMGFDLTERYNDNFLDGVAFFRRNL